MLKEKSILAVVLLLMVVTCSGQVYNQAPKLAGLVAEGKLPEVAQRLPDDPMVVEPVDSIGKYGGDMAKSDSFN